MNESQQNSVRHFEIKPEFQRFFSSNPFVVLGVSANATADEVGSAKKSLLRKYHPDRFASDPNFREVAEEISKSITEAEVKIAQLTRRPEPSYEWAGTNSDATNEESFEQDSVVASVLFQLYYMDTKDCIKFLKNKLSNKTISPEKLVMIFNSPEAFKKLADRLLLILAVSRKYDDEFEGIEEFVKEFRDIGAPVDEILNNVLVGYAINNHGLQILTHKMDQQRYVKYVENWKRLGVDANVVKSGFFQDRRDKDVEDFFKKAVEEIMSGSNLFGGKNRKKKKLQSFVDEWSQLGWVPPKEVVDIVRTL